MSNFCQEFFYFITFFRPGSDRKLNNTNNHYNQSFQGSSDSHLLDFMSKIALKPKLPDVDKFEKITRIKKNILTIENYNEVTKKAHPDFYEISQYNLSLRASSFFSQGSCFR